eukprot:bmy_21437T0
MKGEEEPWVPNMVDMTVVSRAEARMGPGLGFLCRLRDEEAPPEQVKSRRVRLSETPFLFGVSGKDIPAALGFLQPQATHREATPHRSTERKAFPPSSTRQQQQGAHATQKPFKCSDCGQAFLKAFELLDHLITHAKERPFSGDSRMAEDSSSQGWPNLHWCLRPPGKD